MNKAIVPRREDFFFPLQSVFDKFYEDFFNTNPVDRIHFNQSSFPRMDVFEDDGHYVVRTAVAGVEKENLSVVVDNKNRLTISGKMHADYSLPASASMVYVREIRASAFERMIQLPETIVGDPTAILKDGVLTLKWQIKPKVEVVGTRSIPIEVKT